MSRPAVGAPVLLGDSPAFGRVRAEAERIALSRHPVMLLGEPGTGKTALAAWLHARSGRLGAFIRLPVTNVAEELRHAELLGHSRGAFTGAVRDRPGAVELANRGTLLLDEIGLASEGMQAALLAVLDDTTVRRVGDATRRAVDVRFIAATNEDLPARVAAGSFRRDLLGRFGFFWLRVPPLRERPEDIVPLFRAFVAVELGTSPDALAVSPELVELLETAVWPDNVRQVLNVARYVAVAGVGAPVLGVEHLPAAFIQLAGDHVDELIERTLRATGGNRTRAAELLGMSRATFYRRAPRPGEPAEAAPHPGPLSHRAAGLSQ
ncbi:MAG: sigma-54-dependent Fis family transcriptional regulator [Gemmatimonadales bacterium]|nr:sigma-54-dependent Fis family transcriptional regulator [Gemmatimonadales bacterium]